ncbi:flavoprotein [Umezawaea sp. Da 62-37]|uniref:flavoprotein n=1 Tax=Umezawaea sp. Da 62-37 TaxID=3075927 RepID=UPI0028F7023A|nr:flavoprotein [Umezawaea sp. Da 62-37]WNV84215.1 flavoprotein [Umezawaea sp. Da 62-37]
MTGGVLGLITSGAGGVERWFRTGLAAPAVERGWRLAVTLTPTAARWLDEAGELEPLAGLTDLPVRWTSRLPSEPKPHPPPDCFVFAAATANSVVKLALGISDNQALTVLCEAMGLPDVPVIVQPQSNEAQRRHPAWAGHLATLEEAGVLLVPEGGPGPVLVALDRATGG